VLPAESCLNSRCSHVHVRRRNAWSMAVSWTACQPKWCGGPATGGPLISYPCCSPCVSTMKYFDNLTESILETFFLSPLVSRAQQLLAKDCGVTPFLISCALFLGVCCCLLIAHQFPFLAHLLIVSIPHQYSPGMRCSFIYF
jgi:hypothetical protein